MDSDITATQQDMIAQTSIRFPANVWRAVKKAAVDEGTTAQALVVKTTVSHSSVAAYLKEDSDAAA